MKGKKRYAKCIKPYETVFEVGKKYRFNKMRDATDVVNIFYENGLRGFFDYDFFNEHFEIVWE